MQTKYRMNKTQDTIIYCSSLS